MCKSTCAYASVRNCLFFRIIKCGNNRPLTDRKTTDYYYAKRCNWVASFFIVLGVTYFRASALWGVALSTVCLVISLGSNADFKSCVKSKLSNYNYYRTSPSLWVIKTAAHLVYVLKRTVLLQQYRNIFPATGSVAFLR